MLALCVMQPRTSTSPIFCRVRERLQAVPDGLDHLSGSQGTGPDGPGASKNPSTLSLIERAPYILKNLVKSCQIHIF